MCSVGRCAVQFRRYARPAPGCVWPLRPQLPNGIVPGPSVRAASDRRDGAWAGACHKSAHSSTACRSAGWKTRKAMVPELLLQHLQTSAPTHIVHGQRETRQQAICVRAGAVASTIYMTWAKVLPCSTDGECAGPGRVIDLFVAAAIPSEQFVRRQSEAQQWSPLAMVINSAHPC